VLIAESPDGNYSRRKNAGLMPGRGATRRSGRTWHLDLRHHARWIRIVGNTEVIAKTSALSHRQLPSGCGHALSPQSPSAFPTAIRRSPSQEPLESSTIVEPLAIVTRLSVPHYLLTCLGRYRTDLPSSAGRPFSATHFLGHCFGLIPASCSFAASAFPVPPSTALGSLP